MQFFDRDQFEKHIIAALDFYEKTAPALARYLDDLYIRVNKNSANVLFLELVFAQNLRDSEGWYHPNTAQNNLFHHLHRIGRDTTGLIDF